MPVIGDCYEPSFIIELASLIVGVALWMGGLAAIVGALQAVQPSESSRMRLPLLLLVAALWSVGVWLGMEAATPIECLLPD